MPDSVKEFKEMLILRQGLMESFVFELPRISLHFTFPKLFDIQFVKVEDYRTELSLSGRTTVREWSAYRNSEFLRSLPERRRRDGRAAKGDQSGLCHFHMTFGEGYLDVLADDFVFLMVSR